jgi:hypothetical protein
LVEITLKEKLGFCSAFHRYFLPDHNQRITAHVRKYEPWRIVPVENKCVRPAAEATNLFRLTHDTTGTPKKKAKST